MSRDDKNHLLAYWRTKDKMRAWEEYQIELEIKRRANEARNR